MARFGSMGGVSRLILAVLWLLPVPVLASRIPAAYVGLQVLGLEPEQAGAMSRAIAERLGRDERFDVRARPSPELLERCQARTGCYCQAARKLGVSHLIYANAGRIPPLYTFELVLIEARRCTVETSLFVSEKHDSRSALQRAADLAGRLLRPREQVSETAAKAERDVDQVPAVVTVLTDTQMHQLGLTRLPELFRMVPGFETIETNWGDRLLHHGLSSTLLFMVDGVPLSNPRLSLGMFGQDFQLKLNHVERVEFVRGPGSVLWGQNAFLGIVNLITRTPQVKGERVRAHVRLGTLDSQELFAGLEGNRRWISYWLSTTWARSRSPVTRVADSLWAENGVPAPVWGNAGTTSPGTDTYLDVVARVRLAGRLDLSVQYFSSKVMYEVSPFGSLLLPDEPGFWDTSNLLYAASWEDSLPLGLRYRISASRYEHKSWEYFIVHPANPDVLPFGFSSLQGNEQQPEVNHLVEARLYHTWERGRLANRGLLGASYLHQQMPEQFATLTTGQQEGVEALDMASHMFNTISAYLQDDFSLLDGHLLFSGGLRYDWHDPFKSALSAQGGILGGVARLHGKLLYNEGFRPPAMNDLYSTTGVMGNPGLRPERSRALSAELAGQPWRPLTLTAGGTVAWLEDLIKHEDLTPAEQVQFPGFTTRPVNRRSLRIYSTYGTVRLSWPRLDACVSYAFKQLRASDPVDSRIPLAAHTASGGVSLRVLSNLHAFGTLSLVGPRTVPLQTPTLPVGVDSVPYKVRGYALVDLGFTLRDLLGMFDLTVKARNPSRYAFSSPYTVSGNPVPLLERRVVSEILFTLAWSRELPWSEGKR